MVHEMMQRVAAADRRMKVIGDLEISLSAADKEAIKSIGLETVASHHAALAALERGRARGNPLQIVYISQAVARGRCTDGRATADVSREQRPLVLIKLRAIQSPLV